MKIYCCPTIDLSCPYYRSQYYAKDKNLYYDACTIDNPPEECDSFAMMLEEEFENYEAARMDEWEES